MATSSDRKVQKGKIAALKHDDAAVKTGSRLLFDDERRTAQFDGYGESEGHKSDAQAAAAPKMLAKDDRARVGLDKAAAVNKTEAADARLDEIFGLDETFGLSSSKAITGSAIFGKWAGASSLMPFGMGYRATEAGKADEMVTVEEKGLRPAPVLSLNAAPPEIVSLGSADGSAVSPMSTAYPVLDNWLYDESTRAAQWTEADIGKISVGGFGFSLSGSIVWQLYQADGVSPTGRFSVYWHSQSQAWRLKALNPNPNTNNFHSFEDYYDWQRIIVKATNLSTGQTMDGALDVHLVDLNEPLFGVYHWGFLNENVSEEIQVGTLGANDTDTHWAGPYTYSMDENSPFFIRYVDNIPRLWKKAGYSYNFENASSTTVS